jgi:hypothetical protein
MIRRKAFCVLALSSALMLPADSQALVDLGQGDWLSGQNALFLELLATEIDELANLTALLANVKMVLQATNEATALARTTYRNYQAVRNYSTEDLIRDAKTGLYKAFPDLKDIERDLILIDKQVENRNSFFSHMNSYDFKMAGALGKVMSHAYKAAIWPHIFPAAFQSHLRSTNMVDFRIWNLYAKSGMTAEVAVKKTALAALSQKVANLVDEAAASGNLQLAAEASIAQSVHQQVVNSTEYNDMYKAELAAREEAREAARRRVRSAGEAFRTEAPSFFRPGGGMFPPKDK